VEEALREFENELSFKPSGWTRAAKNVEVGGDGMMERRIDKYALNN